MFVNESLQEHLETSSTIRLQSLVIAEWNMNVAENIGKIGNYRYRPTEEDSRYSRIAASFSYEDLQSMFYTGATDADVVVDGGLDANNTPIAFISSKEKEKMLYSLEDCFGRFRPRSGINKLRYFEDRYSHFTTFDIAQRPRYYMADKKDPFKYWTSYRTENGLERGIANQIVDGSFYIEDAAPFIVYKNPIPVNRIVVKMQTNVGSIDLGPFTGSAGAYEDPFFGDANRTVPINWEIQYLVNGNWNTAIGFDAGSLRRDGSQIIKSDGYVEIGYGLVVPEEYYDIFKFEKQVSSETLLPNPTDFADGVAFLVLEDSGSSGSIFIVIDGEYQQFQAAYGWQLLDESIQKTNLVTDLTDPQKFIDDASKEIFYREFEYIQGLRIVVQTMNKVDSTFDLIELSPRLAVDLSDKVTQFSIKKPASDLGVSGLPVGQLLAATGNMDIFDYDQAFFQENNNSLIRDYTGQNFQIKFYESIIDVDGSDFYIPIKTMYSEGFPSVSNTDRIVSLELRDLFFYFESSTAPQMLIQSASLSYAISLLLDSIGFSNYVFKRNENETEEIIPYFYIEPDKSIAEILNDLARSTQSAMFFDEYNNFIVMSKGYILPTEDERQTDIVLYGTKDFEDTGVRKNERIKPKLSNIISISSQDNEVYNDGIITYSTRYIQRSYSSIRQATLWERDKTWIYKPSLIWEVAATENVRSVNQEVSEQSAYTLAAIPLNSDLSDQVPFVANNQIQNNIIDLGDGIYWLTRYNGYLYANGEIIRFDAVEYCIPGLSDIERTESGIDNVWISSVKEYQRYFSKIPFNGKIFPTGLVRIFAEPSYEVVEGKTRMSNGPVVKHGRCQFGTGELKADGTVKPIYHNAGLASYWTDDNNIRGILMDSKLLFNDNEIYKILDKVTLLSNSPTAVFSVQDASIVKVGEYVEKYSTVQEISIAVVSNAIQKDTRVSAIDTDLNTITLDKPVLAVSETNPIKNLKIITKIPNTITGPAGVERNRAQETSRTGLIKNFLSTQFISEIPGSPEYPATTQSSALVMEGAFSTENIRSIDHISYVYKNLPDRFRHFGTRMRIVGKYKNNDVRGQEADGIVTYFTTSDASRGQDITVAGASAGMGIMINPETNNGYYFELAALTPSDKLSDYDSDKNIANMFFYKIVRNAEATSDSQKAIPIKLWNGIGNILVDSGDFVGQARLADETSSTVYDIAIEHETIGTSRRFYIYVNNVIVAIVDDDDPLPIYNNMGLFVRGSTKAMFENIYALTENYSQNSVFSLDTPARSVFGVDEMNATESFRKYAVSGLIQSTYLSGLGPNEPPKYKIYFEEFGTIMREAAYFNIRYDKAYPVLSAQISPTFNRVKGYTVSGFRAGSYGAEFLIFNNTDSALNLDSTSGNYLRIQGVAFTQQSDDELSVDQYFERVSNLSDPEISGGDIVISPEKTKQQYQDIKFNRISYGRKQFNISAPYIQSQDSANSLMQWLTEKVMKKRKSVGLEIFALPILQLGDIVTIDYVNENNVNEIATADTRFVVYYIEYDRSEDGPSMTVYLSEVT